MKPAIIDPFQKLSDINACMWCIQNGQVTTSWHLDHMKTWRCSAGHLASMDQKRVLDAAKQKQDDGNKTL